MLHSLTGSAHHASITPPRILRAIAGRAANTAAAFGGVLVACAAVSGQLTNGSFELPVLAAGQNIAYGPGLALTGWTITGGGIDHDSTFQASHGNQSISTCWVNPGGVSQPVATVNGAAYTISFDATRERPEQTAGQMSTRGVEVRWNGALVGTVVLPPNLAQTNANMMWQRFTYTVQGTGSDTLSFTDVPSGVPGFGAQLDNASVTRVLCPASPSPTALLVPKDVRCGDLAANTAHYSIDSLGTPINNPGGYVTVGQRNLPSGLAGLHVVRWNVNGTVAVERLFSILGSPNESIVGTSVDADANCDLLVAGRIQGWGGSLSNFVVRLNPALMPIGAGVRLNGPVESGVDVQADWLADGTVIVYDRLNMGSGVIDSRVTRRTATLGPMWSRRYHSFQVPTGSQFRVRDIEQDPVSGNIFVCGTMNWPLPAGTRTLPMVSSLSLAAGAVLGVSAYDVTSTMPWTGGGFDAIKFNPSAGQRLNQVLVAGWVVRPGATQFDPPVYVPHTAMVLSASLGTIWNAIYPALGGWMPATSAIGVAPSVASVINNITVAGRVEGAFGSGGGDLGFTLNVREPNGVVNWAQRHGGAVGPFSSYAAADISPGGTRRLIGYYSDLNPFPGGGSLLWKGEGACPAPVTATELVITPPAMGSGELQATSETDLPFLTLQEWPVTTVCTTICRGCYANCDQSTAFPVLNVQDFACFLNAFAAGEEYANCDESTASPVLNVQDFACFLNAFAAGCS